MAANNKLAKIAEADEKSVASEFLKISFEYLDWATDYFFFHGMEEKYYQKFFECITSVQLSKEKDISQQNHPSLSPKSIFNSDTSIRKSFPDEVEQQVKQKLFVETRDEESSLSQAKEITRRAFEISLSKNYGRLHGFLWNNTFHVVWLDPAHNLYCGKRAPKKHQEAAVVNCFSPDEVTRLQEVIRQLQIENAELLEAFANL